MNREQGQLFHPSNGLGGKKEEVNATIIPLFRNSDPITSKKAAKGASKRSPSQQVIILKAFGSGRGFTDEEVGMFTGLALKPRCCYWKRCSELRELGLLEDTGVVRPSSAGCDQRAFRITMLGMDAARRLR